MGKISISKYMRTFFHSSSQWALAIFIYTFVKLGFFYSWIASAELIFRNLPTTIQTTFFPLVYTVTFTLATLLCYVISFNFESEDEGFVHRYHVTSLIVVIPLCGGLSILFFMVSRVVDRW